MTLCLGGLTLLCSDTHALLILVHQDIFFLVWEKFVPLACNPRNMPNLNVISLGGSRPHTLGFVRKILKLGDLKSVYGNSLYSVPQNLHEMTKMYTVLLYCLKVLLQLL